MGSHADLIGPRACSGQQEPEWARCDRSCECCMSNEIDVGHMVQVTNAASALSWEFQARPDPDIVPSKSIGVPPHVSNSRLHTLTGKQMRRAPPQHDADEGHGPTVVTSCVTLVDASSTQTLECTKVSATLVIDCTCLTLEIVPGMFSHLPTIRIPFDKIEAIFPGEDDVLDPRCACLDAIQLQKAVLIQFMSECRKVRTSVCFVLESPKGNRSFVKAFKSIWHEKQRMPPEKTCRHKWSHPSLKGSLI